MNYIFYSILVICAIAFVMLFIMANGVTDVWVSRSLSIANGVSLLVNGKIEPIKYRFRVVGYRVFGKYKGYDVTVSLHYDAVEILINIAEKMPRQYPFLHVPKYTGDMVRVGKNFSIYLRQPDILENGNFMAEKFENYVGRLILFVDDEKSKSLV